MNARTAPAAQPRRARRLAVAVLAAASLVAAATVAPAGAAPAAPSGAAPSTRLAAVGGNPAVVSSRILGYSVKDRPIRAFELGRRSAATTVVAIGAMHGNETEGSVVLRSLVEGAPLGGVHLWVVPRDNPDGVARNQRHNARGVDLNRNFPTNWAPLTGWYYSGPRPASEPETRILMRFLDRVDPDYVVTMHSPLYGIDVYGAKDRPFARRLSEELGLPRKEFSCTGECNGTLTQWFNRHHAGACVTVEFGESPTWRYLHVRAPRGLVRAIGGHFVAA